MVDKNFIDDEGNRQGYWEESYDNELHCGYYDNGFSVGVWRSYRDDFLINSFSVYEPYWDVYYDYEMVEHFTGTEDIHAHYNE